jgi:para-aminobenzoate synthetase component 1
MERLCGLLPRDRALLLHSGRWHERWAKRSILGTPAAVFRYTADHQSQLERVAGDSGGGAEQTTWLEEVALTHHLWTDLRQILNVTRGNGRWMGYIGYEVARLVEPGKLGRRRETRTGEATWPVVELAWCPADQVEEVEAGPTNGGGGIAEMTGSMGGGGETGLVSNFTREEYEAAVRRVIDYIRSGDVFQVNLAQRFGGVYRGSPRELYGRLAAISPAWYGSYMEMGDRVICSASPELFLEVADRQVITRPIKGTRPTGGVGGAGERELRESGKDAAELHMIVDLMRNDLGRVCDYGSVRVEQAREIETHPTVHHGVATVSGRLHAERDMVDLLRATLPGGSVTGAPKVRAMQIIDELEPDGRGPYCGAIGWIDADGCQLNIAIRTIFLSRLAHGDAAAGEQWHATFSVGGGVVADSDPAAEYDETLVKARAMMAAMRKNGGRD